MRYLMATITALTLMASPPPANPVSAKSPAELLNLGNDAYRAGNYQTAIDIYGKVGIENSTLYYNKANAHFKKGNAGQAILNYRRALRIKPRDKDILFNLEYARASRQDKMEKEDESLPSIFLKTPYRLISMNESAAITVFWFTLLMVALFAVPVATEGKARKKIKIAAQVAMLLLLIQSSATAAKTYSEKVITSGVVTAKSSTAFSAPSSDADKLFELHDGAEVRIERAENGYVMIILPTGWSGWIDESSVSKI